MPLSVGSNNKDLMFSLDMEYSVSGKVLSKNTSLKRNSSSAETSDIRYAYNAHKVISATDEENSDNNQQFTWDYSGNLLTQKLSDGTVSRSHQWDDENRMAYARNGAQHAFYMYDAGGERTYKNTGSKYRLNVDNYWDNDVIELSNPTVYPNPYIVANAKGITKHYYTEGKRFASELTTGNMTNFVVMNDTIFDTISLTGKRMTMREQVRSHMRAEDDSAWHTIIDNQIAEQLASPVSTEGKIYYHADHLGSTSSITDKNGTLVQHLQYMPFGEVFIDKKSNVNFDTPFKFNGKEQDEETGFTYYGARYYLGSAPNMPPIFASVDPLADKYPGISPYAYCLNNPLKYVDPDGRSPYYDVDGNYLGNDENGFKGKIFITTKDAFGKSAKDGVADSKILQGTKGTVEFYKNRNNMSDDALNTIFNHVVDGTVAPDGTVLKSKDFNIYKKSSTTANALYEGTKNGVHQVGFDIGDYEWSVENIRGVGIHEIWGHGMKGWGDKTKNHHLIYQSQMESQYWGGATDNYKKHVANTYYRYLYNETGSTKLKPKYSKIVNEYYSK